MEFPNGKVSPPGCTGQDTPMLKPKLVACDPSGAIYCDIVPVKSLKSPPDTLNSNV
jgi:hypothetical protein